jgi:nucleotide-binding universal stress UspA family protein
MITSGYGTAGAGPSEGDRGALVVVGVDDSPQARAALVWAAGYAQRSRARVVAVAVWSPQALMPLGPDLGAGAVAVARPLADEQLEAEAGRWLSTAMSDLPADAAQLVDRSVVAGDAATALLDAARDAELLVLGNAGRGALAAAVVGSIAARCVHHAECPIVLVPDPARCGRATTDTP